MSDLRILPLGACLLHGPLNTLIKTKRNFAYAKVSKGPLPGTYTFGEMFQAIDVLQGKLDVPQEIRPLCAIHPSFATLFKPNVFAEVDVALVEPATPIEIEFGPYRLNRATVMAHVTNPIKPVSKEAAQLTGIWFNKGLMGCDEEARAAAADKLIRVMPGDMPNADLAREVLREAHGVKRDVLQGFERIRDLIGRPIGVITYIFHYLPDGRPISWPEEFRGQVINAAQSLNFPVFEPSSLVARYGVQTALGNDLRHYKDEFLPVVGDALIEFAVNVAAQAPALTSA